MLHYIRNTNSLFVDPITYVDIGIYKSTVREYEELNSVIEYLKKVTIISLDVETTGVDVLEDTIVTVQIGDLSNQYVIDARTVDIIPLAPYLSNPMLKIIGVNIKFDYNMLKKYDIYLMNVECLMLDEMVLTTGLWDGEDRLEYERQNGFGRFSMEGIYYEYYKSTLRKEIRNTFANIKDKPLSKDQLAYGASDIAIAFYIKDRQDELLGLNGFRKKFHVMKDMDIDICELEGLTTLALGDVEYNGMLLDQNKWKDVSVVFTELVNNKREALDNKVIEDKIVKAIQTDLFGGLQEIGINWKSVKQKIHIFSKYGIQPKDKYGKVSTSSKVLEKLTHPLARLLMDYNKAVKQKTTYGIKFLNNIKKDKRLHTSFYQIISTGRVSSNKPRFWGIH